MPLPSPIETLQNNHERISYAAKSIISTLHQADFQGYLVGGCVRDLLLGRAPKDFDIATNAHPDQVAKIFKNARIIGKRFKIVHVYSGGELIEVTTYRGNPQTDHQQQFQQQSHTGQLTYDNCFGTLDEDINRRDITINAMYYDPVNNKFIDKYNGVGDLRDKVIRMIDNPAMRFKEDPVRILRVIRFAAKLEFSIEPLTMTAAKQLGHTLHCISAARLFGEYQKLVFCHRSVRAFALIEKIALFEYMFPTAHTSLHPRAPYAQQARQLIDAVLVNTDERLAFGKSITPAFILVAIFWFAYKELAINADNDRDRTIIMQKILNEQNGIMRVPARFMYRIKAIWLMQTKFNAPTQRSLHYLSSSRDFRAAYDFFLLRQQCGEDVGIWFDWWNTYVACPVENADKLAELKAQLPLSPKRRRRTRKS